MYGDSIFKVIINSIKNFFKILVTLVASAITSIFGIQQKNDKTNKDIKEASKLEDKKDKKKQDNITDTSTALPDDDNIKTNPHKINNDDSIINPDDIKLQKPQRLYKVYTKDNELKYLTLEALLDLLLKEDLEARYKQEKFKLKTASSSELIKIDKIKKRVYPEVIERAEKDILRNSDMIREALTEKLDEDQLINPLFPPRPTLEKEDIQETITRKSDTNETAIEEKEETKPSITNEIKNATLVGATLTAEAALELLSSSKDEKYDTTKADDEIDLEEDLPKVTIVNNGSPDESQNQEEEKEQETVVPEEPTPEEIELEEEIEELQAEITSEEEKTIEELEKLKEEVEEKIEQIKKEEKKKDKKEPKKEEKVKELITDKEIIDVSLATTAILDDAVEELAKEDFEERDYDKIERQINKMLDDITNTFLKYESTMTPSQKAKLKKEEQKLRTAKDRLYRQKDHDIEVERTQLQEEILEIEKSGLQKELKKIHDENQREVSPELFRRMENLEGLTREQVANMDKRILLNRFRKANLALELTSILALPFVRNKYFFAFTTGLIVDNHFNFINAFFRRRINQYEPADLDAIKRGQDALNGALDITYKNLTELDYLEQQALSRYPELANDPRYVSQVTSLRTNLTKKYNKLMKKNQTMEKYRLKTKKHNKILKRKRRNNPQEDERR